MFRKTLFSLTVVAIVVSVYMIFFIAPIPIDPMEAFILLLVTLVILRMENEKLADEIVFIKRTKNL